KATKGTKTTKKFQSVFFVIFFVTLVIFVAFVPQPSARLSASARVSATERQPASAGGWPPFPGNPHMTGAASELPTTLSLKWTYQATETIESSAAIADGVVYVGAGNGDLLAIDLETGKLRWKYATGNLIGESSPTVAAGLVYIGDLEGMFHAVHA